MPKPFLSSIYPIYRGSTLILGILLSLSGWVSTVGAQALPKEFQNPKAKVTMLEFSAPWCLSCKKLKPEVEALQKELGKTLQVHHLNVDQPQTEKYLALYKIESAPTFVIYNQKGKILHRIERDITPAELRTLVKGSLSSK